MTESQVGTCDQCRFWNERLFWTGTGQTLSGEPTGWGECGSGKHVETGWTVHGDESSLTHHVEAGCDCARSVVETGPKYGCIHFSPQKR